MSKKNILKTEHLDDGRSRVTFDAADGERTYEYYGNSARAIKRGSDPANLMGKLVHHKKLEDKNEESTGRDAQRQSKQK